MKVTKFWNHPEFPLIVSLLLLLLHNIKPPLPPSPFLPESIPLLYLSYFFIFGAPRNFILASSDIHAYFICFSFLRSQLFKWFSPLGSPYRLTVHFIMFLLRYFHNTNALGIEKKIQNGGYHYCFSLFLLRYFTKMKLSPSSYQNLFYFELSRSHFSSPSKKAFIFAKSFSTR